MILYAAAKAVALGLFEYHTLSVTFERGLTALQSAYRDGQMSSCSAECGGFSIYPQTYGSYPWGNAPTIAFLALLEDIKI
jgi:hypothetical protein